MDPNSSGSVERFTLATNESKIFEVLAPGGTPWSLDVTSDIFQDMKGDMSGANAVVALQTAEKTDGVAASLTTNLTGATNNDLVFTAKSAGAAGNNIKIAYSDPGGVTATASVYLTGNTIVVSLGRASSAVNTTAAAVKALIDGYAPAAALVSVDNAASNDGTGLVAALAATALSGGADAGPLTFTTVGSALTVVPGGAGTLTGKTGRYTKIINTGSGLAIVVAKALHRVQPFQAL
jgi:hypothetical protein